MIHDTITLFYLMGKTVIAIKEPYDTFHKMTLDTYTNKVKCIISLECVFVCGVFGVNNIDDDLLKAVYEKSDCSFH